MGLDNQLIVSCKLPQKSRDYCNVESNRHESGSVRLKSNPYRDSPYEEDLIQDKDSVPLLMQTCAEPIQPERQ